MSAKKKIGDPTPKSDNVNVAKRRKIPERITVNSKLELTGEEERLFEFLMDLVQHKKLSTTLRVAGGWVRDRLLGRQSSDIDIALDDMSGVDFANLVVEHLHTYAPNEPLHRVGVIAANPDQSKHLEAATITIFEHSVDFVNLRSEEYSEHSRIPHAIGFGTPKEDADRRDLTINALFYNINEKRVEDPTGMGIDDLNEGIIRTPLDPETTFLDDPLRILRSIRFGARLHYTFDPKLVEAARNERIDTVLMTKISRERVGKEVVGMLKHDPERAFGLIEEWGIFNVIFPLPSDVTLDSEKNSLCPEDSVVRSLTEENYGNICIDSLERTGLLGHEIHNLAEREHEEEHLTSSTDGVADQLPQSGWFAALFCPLRHFSGVLQKRPIPLPVHLIKSGLSLSSKLANDVHTIISVVDEIYRIKCVHQSERTVSRLDAGRVLRTAGPLWNVALHIACSFDVPLHRDSTGRQKEAAVRVASQVRELHDAILALDLDEVWQMKPLLNGRELQKTLRIERPGPVLSYLTNAMIDWQLVNPKGTVEQLVPVLQERYPVLLKKAEEDARAKRQKK